MVNPKRLSPTALRKMLPSPGLLLWLERFQLNPNQGHDDEVDVAQTTPHHEPNSLHMRSGAKTSNQAQMFLQQVQGMWNLHE